jgi:hypothetical protein
MSTSLLASPNCETHPETGLCTLEMNSNNKVLIYLRGHVPANLYNQNETGFLKPPAPLGRDKRITSANEALKTYGLEKLNISTLILSTVSHFYVDSLYYESQKALFQSKDIYIASHSGSYRILNQQLKALEELGLLPQVKGIYLLDNFYGSTAMAMQLQEYLKQIDDCRGFYTTHNLERFNERYKNQIDCKVTYSTEYQHVESVSSLLKEYLN